MRKLKIGLQLWSVHKALEQKETAEKLILNIKKIGYEGVELYNIDDLNEFNRIVSLLDKYNIPIIAAHCNYENLDSKLNDILNMYLKLGIKYIVVPISFDITKSKTDMNSTIQRLLEIQNICTLNKIELYYHNHDCECIKMDGDYILNHIGRSGIKLEYDTHWLIRGGLDPYNIILSNFSSNLLHIKDIMLINNADDFNLVDCAVGKGNLNLEKLIKCVTKTKIEWLIVEQEYNSEVLNEQIEDITTSFNQLDEARRKYGN
ncbi:MAG: sugar phosphate isomerase/epimerase family protein [Anaerocolumna sp.]